MFEPIHPAVEAFINRVEGAHFRSSADTGANEGALLLWNIARATVGLPSLTPAKIETRGRNKSTDDKPLLFRFVEELSSILKKPASDGGVTSHTMRQALQVLVHGARESLQAPAPPWQQSNWHQELELEYRKTFAAPTVTVICGREATTTGQAWIPRGASATILGNMLVSMFDDGECWVQRLVSPAEPSFLIYKNGEAFVVGHGYFDAPRPLSVAVHTGGTATPHEEQETSAALVAMPAPIIRNISRVRPGFEIPESLSQDGVKAAKVFTRFFAQTRCTDTGGCRTFYSPAEWAERGEEYGRDALLVIVHDGGDVARVVNLDYGDYKRYNRLVDKLAKAGFYIEACTCWYSAVYLIDPPAPPSC